MKIKQMIIYGLIFGGLAGLIAEFLSEDICRYRSLNWIELKVLDFDDDSTKAKQRRICYIETRQVYGCLRMHTPPDCEGDPLLQEFKSNGAFDQYYGKNVFQLIKEYLTYIGQARAYIAIWFIRKTFDLQDNNLRFSQDADMLINMWWFWRSTPTIIDTIDHADVCCRCTYTNCLITCLESNQTSRVRTAFSCVTAPKCLCYPYAFQTAIACGW